MHAARITFPVPRKHFSSSTRNISIWIWLTQKLTGGWFATFEMAVVFHYNIRAMLIALIGKKETISGQ